ncbi:hypothetical protein ATANTOWER_023833 [Ataeniobius toweri]|uniref:Uncharacterized protein n=1 Tax=Ataeniobius toweri TaxID=208326 RepID=A0ABU7CB50_9TELE|nr:hypothetical protein [Ataeniobius toweri]
MSSSLARDSQLELGLDFDCIILTHKSPFHCSPCCMLRVINLQQRKIHPGLKSFATSYCFSFGVLIHFPLNLTSFPVPAEEKYPNNMMPPPPCFSLRMSF